MTLYNEHRIESARLAGWDYASGCWYFVTICTQNRECSLGRESRGKMLLSAAGIIADAELEQLPSHYENVIADCWVVMPNHVHAILVID